MKLAFRKEISSPTSMGKVAAISAESPMNNIRSFFCECLSLGLLGEAVFKSYKCLNIEFLIMEQFLKMCKNLMKLYLRLHDILTQMSAEGKISVSGEVLIQFYPEKQCQNALFQRK